MENKNNSQQAFFAKAVFDGRVVHENSFVHVRNGRCVGVTTDIPGDVDIDNRYKNYIIAPGLVDCQVNGAGGHLFNQSPTYTTLQSIAAAVLQTGVTSFVPTLITDVDAKMADAASAIAASVASGLAAVAGLHLEGPFISQEKSGVHRSDLIRIPTLDDAAFLVEIKNSIRPLPLIVTLAPEVVPSSFILRLVENGIVVNIGHTNATYEEASEALRAGARGFTHITNAMPAMEARRPGAAVAALTTQESFFGIIADNVHIHPAMLEMLLTAARVSIPYVVTDAMPPLKSNIESFELVGTKVYSRNGRCETSDGHLAGSQCDMLSALRNVRRILDCKPAVALRLGTLNPALFLQSTKIGCLRPGAVSSFIVIDDNLELIDVVV